MIGRILARLDAPTMSVCSLILSYLSPAVTFKDRVKYLSCITQHFSRLLT